MWPRASLTRIGDRSVPNWGFLFVGLGGLITLIGIGFQALGKPWLVAKIIGHVELGGRIRMVWGVSKPDCGHGVCWTFQLGIHFKIMI